MGSTPGTITLKRSAFRLAGDDALEAIQGQLSQDLAGLSVGAGTAGALLTPQGHLRAEVRVLKGPERWWLDCPQSTGEYLRGALHKACLGRNVIVTEVTDHYRFITLISVDSALESPPQDEHAYTKGAYGLLVRSLYGIEAIVADARYKEFIASLAPLALASLSADDLERRRIIAGRVAIGVDTGPRTLVQEAGVHTRLVSFAKGCYVGQEPVARLHWRGKANRRLRQIECAGSVDVGMEVRQDGIRRGHITSVTTHQGAFVALAMLRRETRLDDGLDIGEQSTPGKVTPVVVG